MNKIEFFNNLHEKLGKKYKIHPFAIGIMRNVIIGEEVSPEEVVKRMTKLVSRRKARVAIYKNVIGFLKNATDEQMQDILQKTKFDKHKTE